ncbi:MAG: arginine--tRNA ligase, partial [Eubacteriales bacterium]|nr:arginine--tRNA ligase [Eubacteriales bacterium]
MKNIIETINLQLKDVILSSIKEATANGQLQEIEIPDISIEVPREREHGDFSTNIAMQLAGILRKNPRQTADIIIGNARFEGTYVNKLECAGPGFINFYLNKDWAYDALKIIMEEGDKYGTSDLHKGQRVMVEFVSANPTGPLHMGNARGGALGDCIANVLEASGYNVTREFYVNDAGNQIAKFGLSLEARYMQLLNGEDSFPFPEDGYQGADIKERAEEYIAQFGDKLLKAEPEARRNELVNYALPENLKR